MVEIDLDLSPVSELSQSDMDSIDIVTVAKQSESIRVIFELRQPPMETIIPSGEYEESDDASYLEESIAEFTQEVESIGEHLVELLHLGYKGGTVGERFRLSKQFDEFDSALTDARQIEQAFPDAYSTVVLSSHAEDIPESLGDQLERRYLEKNVETTLDSDESAEVLSEGGE